MFVVTGQAGYKCPNFSQHFAAMRQFQKLVKILDSGDAHVLPLK